MQFLWPFILKSLSLKHQNCSDMLEKLPLKSTKFNLDVSNFWEFENESWEWNESSHNRSKSRGWEWDESFPWESQFQDRDESLAEVCRTAVALQNCLPDTFKIFETEENEVFEMKWRRCTSVTLSYNTHATCRELVAAPAIKSGKTHLRKNGEYSPLIKEFYLFFTSSFL